ncbi:HIRAN domain-containing protein [Streptococcus canis]|uniref:HIRAN domain-containing protein n=1 Tax=Streptococcus canis TaxID=1329 RepID=UPI0013D9B256|nr:HIRAN domain-containing protein [Streptococcus canis]QKG77401.1 hypothetical protein GE021_004345 [Streptococcus canis]
MIYKESFFVAGVNYRKSNLKKAKEWLEYSYDYDEYKNDDYFNPQRYEYYTQMVYLEREPNNEFDKNAIKVLINNIHVGYIPKKKAKKIAKLIDNGYNYRAELSIDECFYQKGDDIYVTIFIFDTESLPIIPPKTVKTLDGDIVYLSDNKESTDSYDCPQEDCEPKVSEIDESEIQRACVGCLLILILTCLFIYFLFR